ncbi:MAG: phosphodiester glycosidase family protein [Cyanobacteria bacterium P01_G01_bin.19]
MVHFYQKRVRIVLLSILAILGVTLSINAESLFHLAESPSSQIRYEIVERSQSKIHTVTIPHDSNYTIVPAVSGLQPLADFITEDGDRIIAAINGGYFDPANHKTTSFVVRESQIVADPRFNERLVDNPDLKQYLSKIFDRAEFRRYSCNSQVKYDIQLHSAPIPDDCTLIDSLGGGPGLLPQDTSEAEAFTAYENGEKIRDAIGSTSLNARSAIGITQNGDVILAMAAQRSQQPLNSGISLAEFREYLADLGAVKAMNLDGGSSASLYYQDRLIYGKVGKDGTQIKRPIKSVLLVKQNEGR